VGPSTDSSHVNQTQDVSHTNSFGERTHHLQLASITRYQAQTTVLADGKWKIATTNGKNGTPFPVNAFVFNSLAIITTTGNSTTAVVVHATRLTTANLLTAKPTSGTRVHANAFVNQRSASEIQHGAFMDAPVNASSKSATQLANILTFKSAHACANPNSAKKEKNSSPQLRNLIVDVITPLKNAPAISISTHLAASVYVPLKYALMDSTLTQKFANACVRSQQVGMTCAQMKNSGALLHAHASARQ